VPPPTGADGLAGARPTGTGGRDGRRSRRGGPPLPKPPPSRPRELSPSRPTPRPPSLRTRAADEGVELQSGPKERLFKAFKSKPPAEVSAAGGVDSGLGVDSAVSLSGICKKSIWPTVSQSPPRSKRGITLLTRGARGVDDQATTDDTDGAVASDAPTENFRFTRGSSCLATPGYRMQSRWDWPGAFRPFAIS